MPREKANGGKRHRKISRGLGRTFTSGRRLRIHRKSVMMKSVVYTGARNREHNMKVKLICKTNGRSYRKCSVILCAAFCSLQMTCVNYNTVLHISPYRGALPAWCCGYRCQTIPIDRLIDGGLG